MARHQTLKNTIIAVDAISQLNQASAVQGIGVDMKGWDSVAFIAAVNAQGNGGAFDMRVVGSINSNFSGNVNISGAAITQAANGAVNVTYAVEVYRPTNRYVKAIYTPTNNANFSAISIRSRGHGRLPVNILVDTSPQQTTPTHQFVGVAEN